VWTDYAGADRAKIVAEVKFGKKIAIEIGGAHRECPPVIDGLIEYAFDFIEVDGWFHAGDTGFPKEDMFAATVERL